MRSDSLRLLSRSAKVSGQQIMDSSADMTAKSGAMRELVGPYLKLGLTAFGGPAAHIALMRDEFVNRRKWLNDAEFLDLVGAAAIIPGPSSTELAIYIGFRRAGLKGIAAAGLCFISPAVLMVMALAWAYVRYGSLPLTSGVLRGVEPVVVAVTLQALWMFGRTALKTRFLIAIGVGATALGFLGVEPLLILAGGGILGALLQIRTVAAASIIPPWVLAAAPSAATLTASLTSLFLVFLKAGAVVFGSGLVLLAFLRADLVEHLHWLTERQLLDAVAVGQVTPGPVFTTATFIGYILQGPLGALVATVGVFLPAFVLVAVSGPLIPRIRRSRVAAGVLDGVNVASLAIMAVVCVHLARASVNDIVTGGIALLSAILLLRFRVGATWLVAGGAVMGAVLSAVGAVSPQH